MNDGFSLMIHGGAGSLDNVKTVEDQAPYLESIRELLENGRRLLETGGSALDTVEHCASALEDNPLFNAGYGSVLNEAGGIEMDAAIMDGIDLSVGAVAAINQIANPIQLARLILSKSPHALLVGDGAIRFARDCNMNLTPENHHITEANIERLNQAKQQNEILLDHSASSNSDHHDEKLGTIGAIARDRFGNLAAATSTGGLINKHRGRVGDTPLIGAGTYADNESCAVSTTGRGEDFIRTVLAKTVSDIIKYQDSLANDAAQFAIDYFARRIDGLGGFILIDKFGNCASRFTTKRMIHGWIEKNGEAVCTLDSDCRPS